ncbi:unnamed protein product [Medioppia subpectinata]|uniref:Uncharacterized protein n=1 Tax=Medioppia subpectinata TaxID=1979941 RepID=A0A7R9LWK1_9ACAR|nr:unnamed protein product [Medioppia subpectinata]CAG2122298.1 unnamed protein product [Medioppia subpectinata]
MIKCLIYYLRLEFRHRCSHCYTFVGFGRTSGDHRQKRREIKSHCRSMRPEISARFKSASSDRRFGRRE